jgi:hypothetical protein
MLAGLATYSVCRAVGAVGCENLALAVGATTAASVLALAVLDALASAVVDQLVFRSLAESFLRRASEAGARQLLLQAQRLGGRLLLEQLVPVARSAIVGMAESLKVGGVAAVARYIAEIAARQVGGRFFLAIVISQCNQLLELAEAPGTIKFLELVKTLALRELGG